MSQKKFHARGFSETVEETRAARIGFKRYIRELEESSDDDDVLVEEEGLPQTDDAIEEMLKAFLCSEGHDTFQNVKSNSSVDEGVDTLLEELELYLQQKNYTLSEISEWMHDFDPILFDVISEELTKS